MRYDKNSPEYISNGHYKIQGEEFMSIWTYKRLKGITPNTNKNNGSEGIKLLTEIDKPHHTCVPDIGNFDEVYLYPLSALEKFYNS